MCLNKVKKKSDGQMFRFTRFLIWHGLKKKYLNTLSTANVTLSEYKYNKRMDALHATAKGANDAVILEGRCVHWIDNFSRILTNAWVGEGRKPYIDNNFTAHAIHMINNIDDAACLQFENIPHLVPLFSTELLEASDPKRTIMRPRRIATKDRKSWLLESTACQLRTINVSARNTIVQKNNPGIPVDKYTSLNGLDYWRGIGMYPYNIGSTNGLFKVLTNLVEQGQHGSRVMVVVCDINIWNRLMKVSITV